jgi:hypothetical protein
MYQSAAYGLIPSQQECFGIPMVRRPILRTTVDQSLGFDLGHESPTVAVWDSKHLYSCIHFDIYCTYIILF